MTTTFTLTPMTALDAVNMMLISIGQTPVNTLDVSGIRIVSIAKTVLQNTAREVMGKGWSFNTDRNYELTPDVNDNITVPTQALVVDPTDELTDYVIRDNAGTLMLYDRENRTFTITKSPLKANITWFWDFDQIPQYARDYIAVRAARKFQAGAVGSQVLHKYTEEDEFQALVEMKRQDGKVKDVNILRDGDFTNAIFHRRFNP